MAKSQPKITLSVSRDIPFNRLVLSQANVRRIKAGVAIEELAEDIARRTLLQSLTVRPILDDIGAETGMYEVPAGGRRYRALELLVKKKRLARTAPIPCIVRTDGLAEEDSLAENVQRAPLHPLDQFRAFAALREKGKSEEEIAAAFFVAVNVVRQRMRLAAVSEKLLDVYAEDGMTLERLMAFTVNPDHARQEQVWEALQHSHTGEAYQIRRMLTEGAVRASDKRAQFVGIAAYEEAGGIVLRDLFEADDGGWLQDPALLDRLVAGKLEREAEAVRAEGWKWIEVAPDFPYGHTYGLRRLSGTEVPPSAEETAARDALKAEFERLEEQYADAEELPEEVDRRLGEIETALEAFEQRPVLYDAAEVGRAGAFVSIDSAGVLRIERGYVRPEDEPPVAAEDEQADSDAEAHGAAEPGTTPASGDDPGAPTRSGLEESDDDEGVRPLSDRLMTELTAHRTLALREAVAGDTDVAFLAALHALCLKLFYPYPLDCCVDIEPKRLVFGAQGSRPRRYRARPRRSRRGTPTGRPSCPRTPGPSGTWSAPSTATAVRRCLRTACRSLSTPCTRPTTAGRGHLPTLVDWLRPSISTWRRRAGNQRLRTISAASPRAASSTPCGRRRGKKPRSASPTSRRPRWRRRPRSCSQAPAGCLSRCARRGRASRPAPRLAATNRPPSKRQANRRRPSRPSNRS